MTTAHKMLFRRFYEDAWNHGDLELVCTLLAPTFHNHEVDTPPPHRELYCQAIRDTRTAFPDWTNTIEHLIAEDEFVAADWRAHGTHLGEAWNLKPTGKIVRTKGLTLVRITNGMITDFWKQDTSHTLLHQLGLRD